MSELLRDEVLKTVNNLMRAEDVKFATLLDDDQRPQVVLARVLRNVHNEQRPSRHAERRNWISAQHFRVRILSAVGVTLALIVLAGVLVSVLGGNSRLGSPITTSFQSGNTFTAKQPGQTKLPRHGTWMLVDDSSSGTWQQIPVGPPGAGVTCPTESSCYEMESVTASPTENSPLLSVSFFASINGGVNWTQYTMPSGFSPTTALSCGSAIDCDAGGSYNGQNVLVSTTDGGHSFTVAPLPSTAGALISLSCTSGQFCGGLASVNGPRSAFNKPNTVVYGKSTDVIFLSTDNGGSKFSSATIAPGNALWTLKCMSTLHCVALGDQGTLGDGTSNWAQGITETTDDGGNTWTSDNLPGGFAVGPNSVLSCPDELHCSVSGRITVTFENPPACTPTSSYPLTLQPTAGTPDAALETIVQFESSLITSANLQAKPGTEAFGCAWPPSDPVAEIMSTSDAGATWTPEQFPANAPAPTLYGLSCPTDNDCWAAGFDQVVQPVPGGADSIESVFLGTTDGGTSWSTVTFSVPAGSPNFESAFGDGIASISCPTSNVCTANGVGTADSSSLPFYRLAISSTTK